MDDPMFKADTHINTCAVLSTLGRHDAALLQAQNAIIILQSSLLMIFLPERREDDPVHFKGKHAFHVKEVRQDKKDELKNDFKDRISILAVAYHSLGVEQEFLKLYPESLLSYQQSTAFAWKYLGSHDGLTKSLVDTYNKAKTMIEAHMKKQKDRQKS
jgi:hypothetical protein